MQSNIGKYKDTTPEILSAGKLFEQGGTAEECIHGRGPEVFIVLLICEKNNVALMYLSYIFAIYIGKLFSCKHKYSYTSFKNLD